MMFLNALQPYIIGTIVAVVLVQYAFALFCLLKLAYFDVSKKQYILWNLFILIVFFIGGAVFLVYYFKHPQLLIKKAPDSRSSDADKGSAEEQTGEESTEKEQPQPAEEQNAHEEKTDEENTSVEAEKEDD